MDFKFLTFAHVVFASLVLSFEMPKVEFISEFAVINDRNYLVFHFAEEFSLEVIQWHKSQYERYFELSLHSRE